MEQSNKKKCKRKQQVDDSNKMCLLVLITSTENERWINDCNIILARQILYTIATYVFNLKQSTNLQQCRFLFCLNAHACLPLYPPFFVLRNLIWICITFQIHSMAHIDCARSLCIILLSTRYKYSVHSCTRSGTSSRSVLRANHISITRVIYIYE